MEDFCSMFTYETCPISNFNAQEPFCEQKNERCQAKLTKDVYEKYGWVGEHSQGADLSSRIKDLYKIYPVPRCDVKCCQDRCSSLSECNSFSHHGHDCFLKEKKYTPGETGFKDDRFKHWTTYFKTKVPN